MQREKTINSLGGSALFFILFFLFIGSSVFSTERLYNGYQKARLGMTLREVKSVVGVVKSDKNNLYYGEHFEVDPDVYIKKEKKKEKVEYYFFEKRLYKIFVIKPAETTSPKFYQKLIKQLKKKYGTPDNSYEDIFFGYTIKHNVWDDKITRLDLRMGAGFIYRVIIHKELNRQKHRKMLRKQKKNKEKEIQI